MGDGDYHAGQGEKVFHDLLAGRGVKAGGDLVGDDEIILAQG